MPNEARPTGQVTTSVLHAPVGATRHERIVEAVRQWGTGTGAEPPSGGQDCDVELGCADLLRWSDDRTLVGDGPAPASVTATVENVQSDGVAALRLLGTILLVKLPDGPRPPVGAAVRLEGVTLEFWPTHV